MFRRITFSIIAVGALVALYVGAYLPYEKARRFIAAYQLASRAATIGEFEAIFDDVLDFYSPVGQREEIRFLTSQILDIIVKQKPPSEPSLRLASYIERKFEESGDAKNDARAIQTLMFLGDLWRHLGVMHNDAESMQRAETYYLRGLAESPRRPQFLYALYALYLKTEEYEKVRNVYNELIKYWPHDPSLRQATAVEKSVLEDGAAR